MPPVMPPEWLARKPSGESSSRCSVPRIVATCMPSPISTPLTALIDISACARSASSRSNTGSPRPGGILVASTRSEEHTSELQSLMRISYAVFCLKKKTTTDNTPHNVQSLHETQYQHTIHHLSF